MKEKKVKEPKEKNVKKAEYSCEKCKVSVHKELCKDNLLFIDNHANKTLAFVMSPIDFSTIKKSWLAKINMTFNNFNIVYLCYPKCFENAYNQKDPTVSILRNCLNTHLLPNFEKYNIDGIICFNDTKAFLSIDDKDKRIEHPGNWNYFKDKVVYLSKGFYSSNSDDYLNMLVLYNTQDKINRYFENKLSWQCEKFYRVTTVEKAELFIEDIMSCKEVALDFETNSLDVLIPNFLFKTFSVAYKKNNKLVSVCFGYEVDECIDINYRNRIKQFLTDLIQSKDIAKICHNVKYETKVALVKLGITFENYHDSMFRSYILNENKISNSLKFLAGDLLDGYIDIPENFETATFDDLWHYNDLDSFYTYKLFFEIFQKDIDSRGQFRSGLLNVERLMLNLSKELALMEYTGAPIDFDYLNESNIKISEDLKTLQSKIDTDFPDTAGINLTSNKQLAEYLFITHKYPVLKNTNAGAMSVDKSVLTDLSELHNCKLATYLLDIKKYTKVLSTYIAPYLAMRDSLVDDRVRCNYMQTTNKFGDSGGSGKGTVTGRLSSAGPNLQNIPRGPLVKKMFVPYTIDHVLLQGDLSQAELRIGCSLANELNMIAAYNNSEDIHVKTGMYIASKEKVVEWENCTDSELKKKLFKNIRQPGKPANFGLIYGGSEEVFMTIAKESYGIILTLEEATIMKAKFFELYPGFIQWHDVYRKFTQDMGFIVSPYGRIRHLPDALKGKWSDGFWHVMNQCINAPVQSACADFLGEVWVMTANQVRKLKMDAKAILTVHDSIIWDVHKDEYNDLIELHNRNVEILTNRYRQTWLKCPMKMDFAVGTNWGELKELGE